VPQPQPQPQHHQAYDIRHLLLQFNSHKLLHKNSPHSTGDRYVLVFFNTGRGDKDATVPLQYLPVATGARVERARQTLLDVLHFTSLPTDRSNQSTGDPHSKYGKRATHAQQWEQAPPLVLSYGASTKSKQKAGKAPPLNANCVSQKYGLLYKVLLQYIDLLHPNLFSTSEPSATYNAFIVAKNAQCVWHTDGRNSGHATLTALGDFTGGGELLVEADAGMCVCVCVCGCMCACMYVYILVGVDSLPPVFVCVRAGDTGV
jgi:hypothetical protein